MRSKGINIMIAPELLQEVDAEAKRMYISRSAYIATALAQKLQQDKAMRLLPEALLELRKQEGNENAKAPEVTFVGVVPD